MKKQTINSNHTRIVWTDKEYHQHIITEMPIYYLKNCLAWVRRNYFEQKDYLTQGEWIKVFTREITRRKWIDFENQTEQYYDIY